MRARVKATPGKKAHFGMVAELCFEKGSELLPGDPERKFKGRHVFLGDNVKDEFFNWAEFENLGSSPPTMEACRDVDALSCFPGYEQTTSDATSAYTQEWCGGKKIPDVETWVSIPRHRWPKEWEGKY